MGLFCMSCDCGTTDGNIISHSFVSRKVKYTGLRHCIYVGRETPKLIRIDHCDQRPIQENISGTTHGNYICDSLYEWHYFSLQCAVNEIKF